MDLDYKIIDLVKGQELLFNKKDKNYRNKVLKDKAWKSIAESLGASEKTIENRWNSLRQRYNKERRSFRTLPSGSGAVCKTWQYYNLMNFLDPFISVRTTYSNVEDTREGQNIEEFEDINNRRETENEIEFLFNNSSSDLRDGFATQKSRYTFSDEESDRENIPSGSSNTFEERPLPLSSSSTNTEKEKIDRVKTPAIEKRGHAEGKGKTKLKRSRNSDSRSEVVSIIDDGVNMLRNYLETPEVPPKSVEVEEDEDLLFCRSLACSLRKIKDERRKLKVKREMLQSIENALDDDM